MKQLFSVSSLWRWIKVRRPPPPALFLSEPTRLILFETLRVTGFGFMVLFLLAVAYFVAYSSVSSNMSAESFLGLWVADLPGTYELRSDDPVTVLAGELSAHFRALLRRVGVAAVALFGTFVIVMNLVNLLTTLFVWRCLIPRNEVAWRFLRISHKQFGQLYVRSLVLGALAFVGVVLVAFALRTQLVENLRDLVIPLLSFFVVGLFALLAGFEYRLLGRSGIFDTQDSVRDVTRVLLARAADLLVLILIAAALALLVRVVAIPWVTGVLESTLSDAAASSATFASNARQVELPQEAIEAVLEDVRLRTLRVEDVAAWWSVEMGGAFDSLLPAFALSALVVVIGLIGLPLARQRTNHRVLAVVGTTILFSLGLQALLRLGIPESFGAANWGLWGDLAGQPEGPSRIGVR